MLTTDRTHASHRRPTRARTLPPALLVAASAIVLTASAALAAVPGAKQATTTQLDAGVLAASDVIGFDRVTGAGFTETGRAAPDPATLARPTGGICDGPTNAARALAADPKAIIAGAVFALDPAAGQEATFNEDAWAFSNAKAAKAFIKSTKRQQNGCETWQAIVGTEPAPQAFERVSIGTARLGDQALKIEALQGAAGVPLDPVTAFQRQYFFIRVGAVVIILNFGRTADAGVTNPTPGYPKDAVTKMKDALG